MVYGDLSDFDLVALVKHDDKGAFAEIFDRYNKLLYNHVYNKLRDEAESRDLVQEVFISVWEKRDSIQGTNLAGLLFTMVRNRVLNLVSHQKVVIEYIQKLKNYQPSDYETTDYLIREKQLAAIIEAEIAALPPKMRQVFEMSRREHLTNKEIAALLSLSEHTVADQIKKSLRILRFKIGLALVIAFLLGY